MKVALCLYGQPRDAHVTFQRIKQNVIDPNDCDVFFHAWYDDHDISLHKMTPGHENRVIISGMNNFIVDQYKPKSHLIEKQRKFHHRNFQITEENFKEVYPWSGRYDRQEFIKDRGSCTHSMWYSVQQSIMMKEMYSHEQGFEYDCVIVSRFDVSPTKHVIVTDHDLNTIVTRSHPYPRGEICDWFFFTNNDNSNAIGGTFNFLKKFHDKIQKSNDKIWNNESFLRESALLHNLTATMGDFDVTF
jgi:hypothetical protein